MHPGNVTASLLVFLAANGTTMFDCLCSHFAKVNYVIGVTTYGEMMIGWNACGVYQGFAMTASCRTLEPPSIAVPATARLPPRYSYRPPPPAGEEVCGGSLAALRGLSEAAAKGLFRDLMSLIADDCIESCSVQGLEDMKWNAETLETDNLWRPIFSQLLHALRDITKAILARENWHWRYTFDFIRSWQLNKTEFQAGLPLFLENESNFSRDGLQLLSLGVRHISQVFIPLAFDHMGIHKDGKQLHRWIKNMENLRDMLEMKLRGWVHDLQSASEQIANYKIEENKNKSGTYLLRRPLLNHGLLKYQAGFLFFRDDFSALCEEQQPKASQMFGLADALYSFYQNSWLDRLRSFRTRTSPTIELKDEKWQLEDRSNATLSVDTDCMQLLANVLDHPTCPLEDLPPETIKRRQQCRLQLWDDMVQRSPHIPVTSYLAYTQRVSVNLCLLAWTAVNSFSICQDVPFSMIKSVHDARCYFDSPDDQSCLESNATEAICSVSRAILFMKCRDFSSQKSPELCDVNFERDGSGSKPFPSAYRSVPKGNTKPSERTVNYKNSLNSATLKYKDFKIDSLKTLEISFIVVNIVFRLLTAGVYMYLPQLRNLPGKIFLSFQVTGIIQIFCSEVMFRMAGVPDLPTMVLIDSALTLLSCICLNSFCYQMYACIRHLRLPNELLPTEANKVFRRQVLLALIPWSTVCVACSVLEKTDKHYLLHSRIIFLVGISISIAFNLVFLGLVGYMYLRNRNSMQQLQISSNTKFGSKKQLFFMSVKTVFLSGIGVIIRIGFHQAQGIAQYVYYVHIATMVQGPLLFVFFICNESTLPILKSRILAWCSPEIIGTGQELCSSAERNMAKRVNVQSLEAESSL